MTELTPEDLSGYEWRIVAHPAHTHIDGGRFVSMCSGCSARCSGTTKEQLDAFLKEHLECGYGKSKP